MTQIVDQPPPIPSDRPSIQSLVRVDLEERERIGVERYGMPLQAHNGRDALVDAYQEAMDLTQYLRQAIEERPREDVDAAVAEVRAELEPQLQRKDDLLAEMRRQLAASDRARDRAAREGYGQAIATLRDVKRRTGSSAAGWAADYLAADPDRLAPKVASPNQGGGEQRD